MRTYLSFSVLLSATLMLSACSQQAAQSPVGQAVKDQLRSGLIEAATAQCVSRVPQNRLLSEQHIQTVCRCTGEKLVDNVPAEEFAPILAGKISAELMQTIAQAAIDCAQNIIANPAAASAAASEVMPN